jgi:hypothetical protein
MLFENYKINDMNDVYNLSIIIKEWMDDYYYFIKE